MRLVWPRCFLQKWFNDNKINIDRYFQSVTRFDVYVTRTSYYAFTLFEILYVVADL